jgi:hypothetical protein
VTLALRRWTSLALVVTAAAILVVAVREIAAFCDEA